MSVENKDLKERLVLQKQELAQLHEKRKLLSNIAEFKIADPIPQRNISFHGDGNEKVGEFNFDQVPATFTGDVDKSARIFVDAVIRMWGEAHSK